MLQHLAHGRVTGAALRRYAEAPARIPSIDDLSPRQREILLLHIRGLSRDDIARRLQISANTVRNHVQAIYDRTGCANRIQALRWALEQPVIAEPILNWAPDPRPSSLAGQDECDISHSPAEVGLAIRFFRDLVLTGEAGHERR